MQKQFPDLHVAGNENGKFRVGAFEVTLDGELVFSKFDTHRFPKSEEVAALVRARI